MQKEYIVDGVKMVLASIEDVRKWIAEGVAKYKDAEKIAGNILHEAAKEAIFIGETSIIAEALTAFEGLEVRNQILQKFLVLTGSYVLTNEGKRFANSGKGLYAYVKEDNTFAALQTGQKEKSRREFCRSEYAHYWKGKTFREVAVQAAPKPFGLEQFAAVAKAAVAPGREWKSEQRNDIKEVLKKMREVPALAELMPQETITAVTRKNGKPGKTA